RSEEPECAPRPERTRGSLRRLGLGVAPGLGALRRRDRGRRPGQRVEPAPRLRERDDLADRVGAGEQHADPVPAERDATVRWRTVLERLQQETELLARLRKLDAEQVEHPPLHAGAGDTPRAAADLVAV